MSRREPTIKVVMRKGNASGRRAGLVLTLDEGLARSWMARGWCDPAPADAPGASGKVREAAPGAAAE